MKNLYWYMIFGNILTWANSELTTIVHLSDQSPLQGTVKTCGNGKIISEFLGIPYAEPPIGSLRFRPPIRKRPWENLLNATNFGHVCWQKDMEFVNFEKSMMSEDCLYLNIRVPGRINDISQPLPVMVWIHGGAFYGGSASEANADPKYLATEERVIIVSMNYRLSIFGFLYANNSEAPGNMGLIDQLEALKWVQRNIAAFGGDPDSVTIFGASAGGCAVGLHAMSSLSEPYFKRFIAQSCSANSDFVVKDSAEQLNNFKEVAKQVECLSPNINSDEKMVQCLRTVDTEKLMTSFINRQETGCLNLTWSPVIDHNFIREHPRDALKNGNFKKTDALVGVTMNETSILLAMFVPEFYFKPHLSYEFLTSEDVVNVILSKFMPQKYAPCIALVEKAAKFEYENWKNKNALDRHMFLERLTTDMGFKCDAVEFSQKYANQGNAIYFYLFNHSNSQSPIPDWVGCSHVFELPFVFGYPLNTRDHKFTGEEKEFSATVMRYWANFARTGNPNLNPDGSKTVHQWPAYDKSEKYIILSEKGISYDKAMLRRQCLFWNEFIPDLVSSCKNLESQP